MKNLKKQDVEDFYETHYWEVCHCSILSQGLDYCVFDYAVNSGPSKAIKSLQKALNITQDGVFGKDTIKNVLNIKDNLSIINTICEERLKFLKTLSTFKNFGKGWETRVSNVQIISSRMANEKNDI
jgi:lysozyme family protein